jgi:hypothetical protein
MKKGKEFDDIPVHIRERVYSDIGEASMCWENPEKAGVFDSQKAAEISLNLCQFVLGEIERKKNEPRRLEERH